MANTSISDLSAGAAVSATDILPNVQTAGVGPVKTTAAQLKTFMSASPTFVTPALGTPASGNFSTGTFTWPTFNQNTSGTAAGLSTTLATTSGGTGLTSFTSGYIPYASSTSALSFSSNLRANGTNLGLGVAISAWHNYYTAFQFGDYGALSSAISDGSLQFTSNAYASGNDVWTYSFNYGASRYSMSAGTFTWYSAAAGTGTISWAQTMQLSTAGDLTIAGSTATKASGTTWANPSDSRLKNNVQSYAKGLTELNQIQVKQWVYNGKAGTPDGKSGVGVIADQIMTVLPETVSEYEGKLEPTDANTTLIKQFDASEIIWLLVKSTQELSAKITELEAKLPK